MAEIAVINKDNQDYDIRDKKLADHTSASTDTSKVSSASSIMLEASDGSFVSVKRDSFVNAIRDVLGSSIVANTGGTSDVNTIPALTSSGGLKSVSTADIASVLGVEFLWSGVKHYGEAVTDIYDIDSFGTGLFTFSYAYSMSGRPSSINGMDSVLLIRTYYDGRILSIILNLENPQLYARRADGYNWTNYL